ncbi:hypothetical protein OsI_32605 [Oryza sativa Indica Group]|uniref:Uncharacterized protein n=1 Tax=Oryza sativa subsp. indica TaxID=39946 RepID=B8BFI5_ORYSI|nr:hypothetical protein OsI_32605 [Oryza sativa Indica Group]
MSATQPVSEVLIRRVTADNLAVEMLTIRSHLPYFPYITIHADYPVDNAAARHGRRRRRRRGGGRGNKRESEADERCYRLAKSRVDELDVLQLGITLCDHHGRLPATAIACPGGAAVAVEMAWQVGFSDFDVSQSAVDALRAAGVDLEHLRARGVPAAVFGQALRVFDIVSAANLGRLTWVARSSSTIFLLCYMSVVTEGDLVHQSVTLTRSSEGRCPMAKSRSPLLPLPMAMSLSHARRLNSRYLTLGMAPRGNMDGTLSRVGRRWC